MSMTCVERVKNKANEIVIYKLRDNNGKIAEVSASGLKEMLTINPEMVDNLTLTSNNRIVTSGDIKTTKLDKSKSALIQSALRGAYLEKLRNSKLTTEDFIIATVQKAYKLGISKADIHEFIAKASKGVLEKYTMECSRNTSVANLLSAKMKFRYKITKEQMATIIFLNTDFTTGALDLSIESVEPAHMYEDVFAMLAILAED